MSEPLSAYDLRLRSLDRVPGEPAQPVLDV
jgi:hypothetical protein